MKSDAPAAATDGRPHGLRGVLLQPIGDEGRAELVERRLGEAIRGGHLRAGERLPSEQDLGRTLGVAPVTVREALQSLRAHGLVVTKRGRNGGSFVVETADPVVFARTALAATSRLAVRDLGSHYAAITVAAYRLAARRADPSETALIRSRLDAADTADASPWRRVLDDAHVELASLSQSARLTREQMRLQAELSPFLRLVDVDPAARSRARAGFLTILDAVEAGDEASAGEATERFAADLVDAVIEIRSELP